jgi:hypothetical protein
MSDAIDGVVNGRSSTPMREWKAQGISIRELEVIIVHKVVALGVDGFAHRKSLAMCWTNAGFLVVALFRALTASLLRIVMTSCEDLQVLG